MRFVWISKIYLKWMAKQCLPVDDDFSGDHTDYYLDCVTLDLTI